MVKKSRVVVLALAAVVGAVVVFGTSGCKKQTEQFRDAPVSDRDRSSAEIYDMPDGFSNFAEKCDRHGNRVYVAFHNDSPYAAIAVVADPTCG